MLFYVREDAKSGLTEIIPLICKLSGASSLCFRILSVLRVYLWECLQWLTASWGIGGYPASILSCLRALHPGGCNGMAWWLWHPLFTDMAGNVFHSQLSGRNERRSGQSGTHLSSIFSNLSALYLVLEIQTLKARKQMNKNKKLLLWELPGGPVVRTLCFHCQGPGFNPWSGN